MSFEDIIVRALNRRGRKRETERDGLYLGQAESILGGERAAFALPPSPIQHNFISGRTGYGKSTLLQRAMHERLRRAIPLINLDFHGQATDELLAMVGQNAGGHPIMLFKPGSDPAIGWNPLHAAGESPHAVVQELISIFHLRLWPDAWGPRLEECLKMTLLALAQAGLTLLEVTSFLSRPAFRHAVLRRVSLPEVLEFWSIRFERLSRSQQSATTEPVLNKMSVFHDPALRYVVGQSDAGLDFERALAQNHTILADLSSSALRGYRFLLAALLVAKFKGAVYGRPPGATPFAVFLDEFQELVAIDALDDYLRSFRKFGCSVFLATQNLALSLELKSAIFGNCSRFFCFATSAADAAVLGREFGSADGELAAELLPELKIGQAIVKERGAPVQLLRVAPSPVRATSALVAAGRERCLRLGKSRREIDEEIARRISDLLPPSVSPAKPGGLSKAPIDDSAGTLPEGYD